MEDLNLGEAILKTHDIIKRVFNKKIEIQLDLEENLPIHGNISLLSQAFMNLFNNARDAMPDGGKLIIKSRKMKNSVITQISDTGHGMDKDVMDKIFDPFFTLKEVGSGTGLGLSTTLGIIEQHEGSITVSSKPGEGTTFKIHFPLSDGKVEMKTKNDNDIIMGNGQKILIIDDEQIVLNTMSDLVKNLGYEAFPVNKSTGALKIYEEISPDIVLIDRNMPELDGIECIRQFMKSDPEARIIIVSGYDESGTNGIEEDIKEMIKGYLTKPCGIIDLSRMIHNALVA